MWTERLRNVPTWLNEILELGDMSFRSIVQANQVFGTSFINNETITQVNFKTVSNITHKHMISEV